MKKILKIFIFVLLAAAALTAVYRFCLRKSIPDAPVAQQVEAILEQNDCFVCHSSNPEPTLMESWPHVGKMIANDRKHATDFIDLKSAFANSATDNVHSNEQSMFADSETENALSNAEFPENTDTLKHADEYRISSGYGFDEVTLSMIEHAVAYNTMPVHAYRMTHWGTGFNQKERAVLTKWIMDIRGGNNTIIPIPDSIPYDVAKAELGEKMFNDMRISLDGTINCATCHVLEDGGADHADERVSEGINGLKGTVNAHTVYNSIYNIQQFWNGRAADLQAQAAAPPTNPVEMGDQTWDQIVARLKEDKALVKEFEELYPGEGLTEATVTAAIAEFEKKLLTPNSRFDQYLKGDSNALSEEELAGYELFKANACICCHTGIVMGGKSFEKLGIYGDYFADRKQRFPEIEYVSDDDGLKGFTGNDAHLQRFKTPGLRNIALTAPYFHDGTYQTLEEAVAAMARYELGKELSDNDIRTIVAFMHSLTGENPYLKK